MGLRWHHALTGCGLLAVLSGCSGSVTAPATIEYSQIGLCNSYATAGGARTAKENEAYVVYKIGAVDNTKRGDSFNFFPYRLYVDRVTARQQSEWKVDRTSRRTTWGTPDWLGQANTRRFVTNDTVFAKSMGVRAAMPVIVPASARIEINGYSIVTVAFFDENEKAEADQTPFKLAYDSNPGDGESIPADPEVIMRRTDEGRASWPHPERCKDLTLEKLAS